MSGTQKLLSKCFIIAAQSINWATDIKGIVYNGLEPETQEWIGV